MKIFKIEIKTLEPVIMGYDTSNNSRNYISGSALRGIFISSNRADENFKSLILNKNIIFTDAYLKEGNDYFIPTPKNYLCNKHNLKELKSSKDKSIDIRNDLLNDLLNGNNGGSNKTESISSFYINATNDMLQMKSLNKIENMHINKSIEEGSSSLYRYEAIPENTTFYGFIIIKDDNLIDNLNNIEGIKYIGKSKNAGYGKVGINFENLDDYNSFISENLIERKAKDNKEFTIYYLTDAILKDKNGNTVSYYDKDDIKAIFGLEINTDVSIKAYIKNKIIGGYNTFQKLPMPKEMGIEAGSVVSYKLTKELSDEQKKSIEENGIGYLRERGLGRVIINPDFENYKMLSKYKEAISQDLTDDNIPIYLPRIFIKNINKLELDRCINSLVVSKSNLIKLGSNVGNSQINQLILAVKYEKDLSDLNITKSKLYLNKDYISIFGETVCDFLENLDLTKDNLKKIDKYLKQLSDKNDFIKNYKDTILKYVEKDSEKEKDKDIVKNFVIELLYYKTRELSKGGKNE